MNPNDISAIRDLPAEALQRILIPVRLKDAESPAAEAVVAEYLETAFRQTILAPSPEMMEQRRRFNESDLNALARQVFETWLLNPECMHAQGVFLLYGIHADDEDVARLWPLIMEWSRQGKKKRGLAIDAVNSLSLSRSALAPMIIDAVRRIAADAKVRAAALEILTPLVESLNISWDELQDYIVPTLGFDDYGELELTAGENTCNAVISPALTLELFDANGDLMTLPAEACDCTAHADVESADELHDGETAITGMEPDDDFKMVLKRFYALERAFKTVVEIQNQRLRLFMLAGRNWDKNMWRRLFIYNPILSKYSGTLVWGVYKDFVLYETFIYRPADGTFIDADGADFDLETISDHCKINPVHVLEMQPELLEAWRNRLAVLGIKQPLRQMDVELEAMSEDSEGEGYILKGLELDDCSDENRYFLERLGRILGIEGKELFLDIYYHGHRCLRERIFYPLTCEAGDPDMAAIVHNIMRNPQKSVYPWLILALERNKNAYWLNELYNYLRESIARRIPNEFGARGLLHANLTKYYDIARDTFILYWEEGLPTDMGIYAFEADARRAVKDILPVALQLQAHEHIRAENISLHGMVQSAYRQLAPDEFYTAFEPVLQNAATRAEFIKAFRARMKYYWNKRDLYIELQMDVPVNQMLKFDSRWYDLFLRYDLVDFIVHSATKDMPLDALTQLFNQITERVFKCMEDLEAFYNYALGMAALGYKDFYYDMLARVKTLMQELPYRHETLHRLTYHMEREATAYGDEFWLQQFILLDPAGFAGVFEVLRETAAQADQKLIDRILKAIYEIIYRK